MDVSLMERFYSKLFSTPKEIVSAGIIVISIVLASILNGSGSFFGIRYLFLGMTTLLALIVYRRCLRLAVNERRLLFFVMIVLIFIELFDVISIHMFGKDLIVLAPATITSFLTVSFYFMSESSELESTLASFALAIALYPISYEFSFQAPHRTFGYVLTALIGSMLGYLFIRYIDRDFEFFNVKRFLKAFFLYWLTCDAEYFERELRKVGVRFRGWVKCLRIGKVRLVSTSFHPGPMRDIGGAKLVERIVSRGNTMYLHTAVGHELNPVDKDNVEKIASSIACDDVQLKAEMPFELKGKRYILRIFPFGRVKLMILIGKEESDDLPFELNKLVGKEIMLVEAHSAYKPNFEVSEEHVREVEELIKKAMEIKTKKAELRYAFRHTSVDSKNLCGHIAVLVLDYEKDVHALVMLDGNNVDLSLRREIEEFFRRRGMIATVISTDNHSKTGISPKIGYKPVGADENDRKVVFDFLNRILPDLKLEKCENMGYGFREVEACVMGKRFFELVDMAFKNIGETAIYVFLSIMVFQFVLASILGKIII